MTVKVETINDEKYQTFLKYEPVITSLIDAGVFDTKNGRVTMDFNHRGHVMDVKVSIETHFKGFSNLTTIQ